jgi:ABC-2 type transport system ATP-binding protein
LVWDIPAIDSFEVNQAVYEVDRKQFKQAVDEYIEILELQDLVRKPVRQLSLGERMKVEIAAALLHRPKVLFLDEPTLGLDVPMQRRIRRFIAEYNKKEGATVLLTSHYMADVQALCKRVIVIHHGEILFDGQLSDLVHQFTGYKEIVVEPKDRATDLSRYGEIMNEDAGRVSLRIPRAEVPEVAAKLLADVPMFDFTVEEPPIEDVIERVFAQGSDETPS